jgi:hypothetical protein
METGIFLKEDLDRQISGRNHGGFRPKPSQRRQLPASRALTHRRFHQSNFFELKYGDSPIISSLRAGASPRFGSGAHDGEPIRETLTSLG